MLFVLKLIGSGNYLVLSRSYIDFVAGRVCQVIQLFGDRHNLGSFSIDCMVRDISVEKVANNKNT